MAVERNSEYVWISIHALRKESDCTVEPQYKFSFLFQSTLSVRRATVVLRSMVWRLKISIHALRKESDCADSP